MKALDALAERVYLPRTALPLHPESWRRVLMRKVGRDGPSCDLRAPSITSAISTGVELDALSSEAPCRYHRAENSSGNSLRKLSVGISRMSYVRANWLAISATRRGEPLPFAPAPRDGRPVNLSVYSRRAAPTSVGLAITNWRAASWSSK